MIRRYTISTLLSGLAALFMLHCDRDPDLRKEDFNLADIIDGEILFELNPHGLAPLTAMAVFQTHEIVSVSVEILGLEPLRKNWNVFQTVHQVPILGLYPDTLNRIVIGLTRKDLAYAQDTFMIRTDTLPSFFPDISIQTVEKNSMEPGWTLCTVAIGLGDNFASYPLIFDNDGIVRWYLAFAEVRAGWITPVEKLRNSNLFFGLGDTIYEYNMLGSQVHTWKLPDYSQTHDIMEKPDGNFLIPVNKWQTGTIDDHIVEMDRHTGAIIKEWDLRSVMDVDRYTYAEDSVDWLHINSVWYSPEDQSLVISGRNQGVIKVNYENNPVWILAPHKGWGQSGQNGDGSPTSEYLLTALNSQGLPYPDSVQSGECDAEAFSWIWGQHAAMYLPDGNLFIFDNGLYRNFSNRDKFSRGVEYKVNEDEMTIQQAWSYGKQRGRELYSGIISDVDLLPKTGNRLLTAGIISGNPTHSTIVEVTHPEKRVVFEARLTFKNMLVHGSGWGAFDINYRAERVRMYPERIRGPSGNTIYF
jgi:arylsulfate sulfotransferase